jgi:hypothetical protein
MESSEKKLLEVRPDDREIKDDACYESIDDAEYHGFVWLGILFKEQRPVAIPVVVLGSDPDVRDFQLDSQHKKGCDKPDACENLGESTCSGFVLRFLHSGKGGLLGGGGAGWAKGLGRWIERNGGLRQ